MNGSVVSDQMYESYYDDVTRRLEVRFADSDYSEIDFGYTIRLLNPRNVGGTFGVFDADGKMAQMGLKVSRNTQYVINDVAEELFYSYFSDWRSNKYGRFALVSKI